MSTLGQRLETLRTERKLTKEQVAQVAQVRGATVGSWERDKIIPRDDKLKRLSGFFKVSYEWLRVGVDGAVLLSTSEEHAALIQPLIKDRAGLIFDKREIPATASHSLVYFRITGHSMGEVLPEGSLVLVDVEDKHIKDGKMYAIKQDEYILVRRLSYTTSGINLQSLGVQGRDELLTFQDLSKLEIVGCVVSSICPR